MVRGGQVRIKNMRGGCHPVGARNIGSSRNHRKARALRYHAGLLYRMAPSGTYAPVDVRLDAPSEKYTAGQPHAPTGLPHAHLETSPATAAHRRPALPSTWSVATVRSRPNRR
eukprot:122597-Prymnesium_polylepis.2